MYQAVLVWWVALASLPLCAPSELVDGLLFCAFSLMPVLVMAWRKRSVEKALYSVVSWCVNAAGLLLGLIGARKPTREAIQSRVLREPGDASSGPVPQVAR
jgi:peptidoglycan/LPS O-acetylase OafA/YrhL